MTQTYTWCPTTPDEPYWDMLDVVLRDHPDMWTDVRVWCDMTTGDTHATYGTAAGWTWHADGHMTCLDGLMDSDAGPTLYCLADVVYLDMGLPC